MSMSFDWSDRPTGLLPNQSGYTKADDNLSYLEFIDLVKYLWEKGHPDIPFVPHSGSNVVENDRGYIVYGLENRRPMRDSPKSRAFEIIKDNRLGKDVEVWLQRFNNIISFAAVHRDPRVAEEIIEVFELFMFEYTPVFKRLGAGELAYNIRYSDREDMRLGKDMAVRVVTFMLTTHQIKLVYYDWIEEVCIDVRRRKTQIVEMEIATPNITTNIVDEFSGATPNSI